MDLTATWLTLRLATASTVALTLVGLPLAWWLAHSRSRWRLVVESIIALPLVLPPTVLGFYLLLATGPRTWLGKVFADTFGTTLPFSFAGIFFASLVFNLPFSIRPFTVGFSGIDRRLIEASHCLGVSRFRTFFRVALPLAQSGVLTGMILTFAHTVGEFGVVLMVGGNIPGVTRTLSIAIYDDVQKLDYAAAGQTALILVLFAFCAICVVQVLNRRGPAR